MTEIDTSVPHSARIWNHWLGGKDNRPEPDAATTPIGQHGGLGRKP